MNIPVQYGFFLPQRLFVETLTSACRSKIVTFEICFFLYDNKGASTCARVGMSLWNLGIVTTIVVLKHKDWFMALRNSGQYKSNRKGWQFSSRMNTIRTSSYLMRPASKAHAAHLLRPVSTDTPRVPIFEGSAEDKSGWCFGSFHNLTRPKKRAPTHTLMRRGADTEWDSPLAQKGS